ncbi:hypothetical protein RRG08_052070 [Elysia crispata]|uniref:Uncharacterized protein n=1 Tax=Elysia crispata TaxID=231223 RepID=A0AAE1DS62_9GAST|nr:hypothetical protein RRG08_052070 [Elysia crispata]
MPLPLQRLTSAAAAPSDTTCSKLMSPLEPDVVKTNSLTQKSGDDEWGLRLKPTTDSGADFRALSLGHRDTRCARFCHNQSDIDVVVEGGEGVFPERRELPQTLTAPDCHLEYWSS